MSKYLCSLDIGGTFTDCVIVDDDGRAVGAKAPSTPGDFAEGLVAALRIAARKCGQSEATLFAETSFVSHGKTVGTGAIVRKRLVRGVFERVDGFGSVVVPLHEAQGDAAVRELLAQEVDAIAICAATRANGTIVAETLERK